MKKTKITAIALASVMLFSTVAGVAGCNKKGKVAVKNEVVEVTEDALWFDYTKKEIKVIEDPSKYEYSWVDSRYVSTTDGYITYYEAYPKNEDSLEAGIVELDKQGEVKKVSKLDSDDLNLEPGTQMSINSVFSMNGDAYVSINAFKYNETTWEYSNDTIIYNFAKNEVEDISYLTSKVGEKSFQERLEFLDDGFAYLVEWSEDNSYVIHLAKDGKYVKSIELSKIFKDEIYGFDDPYTNSDTINIMIYSEGPTKWISISKSDYSASVDEIEDVPVNAQGTFGSDGAYYTCRMDGIYRDEEMVMPFSATYVNASTLSYSDIIAVDGDTYTLVTTDYNSDTPKDYFYTFTKAATNPNAGKDIITVGMINYMDSMVCEAISKFNESNDSYFIQMQNYIPEDTWDYEEVKDWTNDDFQKHSLNENSELVNSLTMDLLNGEGPDILVNIAQFPQLNNEDYLMDVTSFVADDLKDIDMFTNVVEAAKNDGKLFQIPITFDVDGIAAKESDVSGAKGFTFDEYTKYVDKVCNGNNPVAMYRSRMEVLNDLIASMSDQFFDEDGNVTFSNEAFYQVAKYCSENVPEEYDDGYGDGEVVWTNAVGYSLTDSMLNSRNTLYGIQDYLNCKSGRDDVKFYGLPSVDGRGPAILLESTIAISAAASNPDAAKDFIKFIFSTDSIFDGVYSNPISVSACIEMSKKGIENNNKYYEDSLEWNSEAELHSYGQFKYDDSVIDEYINVLKSAEVISSMDPNISLIILEEIPAYFVGQKSIEDVASVIQDRAQTVIDERG